MVIVLIPRMNKQKEDILTLFVKCGGKESCKLALDNMRKRPNSNIVSIYETIPFPSQKEGDDFIVDIVHDKDKSNEQIIDGFKSALINSIFNDPDAHPESIKVRAF
jgi:hypothetical protein